MHNFKKIEARRMKEDSKNKQCFFKQKNVSLNITRNSPPEVFLGIGVLKICSKFTGEHPYRSAISIKLLCKFCEIILGHGCSPVYLLHIFRTLFLWTLLDGCFWLKVKYCRRWIDVSVRPNIAKYELFCLWNTVFWFCYCLDT